MLNITLIGCKYQRGRPHLTMAIEAMQLSAMLHAPVAIETWEPPGSDPRQDPAGYRRVYTDRHQDPALVAAGLDAMFGPMPG